MLNRCEVRLRENEVSEAFWRKDPSAPYATLVRIARTYCHPEADEEAYDDLKLIANDDESSEMVDFKNDLRRAIRNPDEVPAEDLYWEVQYDDGSADKFLRRLWRDLYPNEPLP